MRLPAKFANTGARRRDVASQNNVGSTIHLYQIRHRGVGCAVLPNIARVNVPIEMVNCLLQSGGVRPLVDLLAKEKEKGKVEEKNHISKDNKLAVTKRDQQ